MALDRILVVDDTPIIRKSLEERLRGKRLSVSTAGSIAEAEKRLAANSFDLIFLDMELPDGDGRVFIERMSHSEAKPIVVMITANGSVETVVECMRSGAFDYVTKPFSMTQIDLVMKKASEFQRAVKVTDFLNRDSISRREIIGKSPVVVRLKELIQRVGRTNATVMISGENGTGKELVANEIFLNSQRLNKPFIKVNCAAISETLIESEFFGHEKGSFTGATDQRDGRFELADGGTILLDEISEISLGLQAKLLRVLQEREFERVGGETKPSRSMFAFSPRRTGICLRRCRRGIFARIFTTDSMSFPFKCRPSVIGPGMSSYSPRIFLNASRGSMESRRLDFHPMAWRGWSPIIGPAMCVNSKMSWSARRF